MQHWITKNGDYVFTADPTNTMPHSTGCRKITEGEFIEHRLRIQRPDFEGRVRKPKKSKEERRAARLARRMKKQKKEA